MDVFGKNEGRWVCWEDRELDVFGKNKGRWVCREVNVRKCKRKLYKYIFKILFFLYLYEIVEG